MRVCRYCHSMYSKLDHIRIKQLSKPRKPKLEVKFVHQQIEKLINAQGILRNIYIFST